MAISEFVEALLRVDDNGMLPEERAVEYLKASCLMLEMAYGKNCARLFHELTVKLLECRSECTRVARTCCPKDDCGCHQLTMQFLNSWGIEPSLGFDDDGHYAEFSIPTRWSMRKRERFIKDFREFSTSVDGRE